MELKQILATRLAQWMEETPKLDSQPKLEKFSGVGQSTLQRILKAEVNTDLGKLDLIAGAFGRNACELLMPEDAAQAKRSGRNQAGISAAPEDYSELELLNAWRKLGEEDKAKVTAFMVALNAAANVKIVQPAHLLHETRKMSLHKQAVVQRAEAREPKPTQLSKKVDHGTGTKKRKSGGD